MRLRRGRFVFISFLLILALVYPVIAEARTIPSLCKIKHPSDTSIEWNCKRLKKGESIESLFGDRWVDVARFNRIDRRHARPGVYLKVPKRIDDIKDFTPMPLYYKPAEPEPRFILVDLSEQFLGAYEHGRLVFSSPVATGEKGNETPRGEFRITAFDRRHVSSLYFIEGTSELYPMHYALRFHISKDYVSYWIHGRDLPGYPASHGCIGLYDEEMQKKYYKYPKKPVLEDARRLFEWAVAPAGDGDAFHVLKDGPKVLIRGYAPGTASSP